MIIFIIIFFIIFLLYFLLNKLLNMNYEYYSEEYTLSEEEYILPKVIYGYFDNPSDIIMAHINTWKRNVPSDWTIYLITSDNIRDFVDEDFIIKYGSLPAYRFSDFLRVHLLSNNGGVWIDAATIILDGSFLDRYYDEMIKYKYDTTLYEFKVHSMPNYPYLENWFIMSRKNSPFITNLYSEFHKSFAMDFLKYKTDILIPNISLDNTLKYGTKTYHMQHAIIHYLLNNGNTYNLNIKDAEESMFKLQKENNWDKNKVIESIITNDNWENYYSIKLVSFIRKAINSGNKQKFINKLNSL